MKRMIYILLIALNIYSFLFVLKYFILNFFSKSSNINYFFWDDFLFLIGITGIIFSLVYTCITLLKRFKK